MLRKIRIIFALVFFIGITLLFVAVGLDWWGWMAKVQLLPATFRLIGGFALGNAAVVCAILLLTLIFGRIYCSVICPMGVFQDIVAWIRRQFGLAVDRINRKRTVGYAAKLKEEGKDAKKPVRLKPIVKHFKFSKERKAVRFTVLAVVIASVFVSGQTLISLVAPYSAYGRMVQAATGNPGTVLLITAILTFVVISLCAWFWGRAWCNTVCPVGTVLGYVAKASVFKVHIDESKCVGCGRCGRGCKASCIDMDAHKIDYSRCVDCFDCIRRCGEGAISFGTGPKQPKASPGGRRAFLASVVLLAGTAAHAQEKRKDGGLAPVTPKADPGRPAPIVPPGALSVKNFQDHCTACQLCVSSCPNGVLKPGTALDHFLQPVMGYQNGWCRPECTSCSDVCPSGAIRPIQRDRKTLVKIGTARVNPELCLAVRGVESCGSCAAHCPKGAITMVKDKETGTHRPVVAEEQCIGCGACEYLCPSRPVSAIVVEGLDIHIEK